jgi:UPF0755 protein
MSEFPSRPRKQKSRKRLIALVLTAGLVLIGGIAFIERSALRSFIDQISGSEYSGQGLGEVRFLVSNGDTGTIVAKNLVKLGVTKNVDSTLRHIYSANPTFFPGTYKLPKQISTDDAIKILTNPNDMIVNRVTIREGLRIGAVYRALSESTGIPVEEFESAGKDLASFGLPKAAPSLEGYLFPATYSLDPGLSAKEVLLVLTNRMKQELESFGVPKSKWNKTLALASVVQAEARQTPDFYKVSRVFKNRIAQGMHLQSDATVSYGVNGSTVSTSAADRADNNGYNTYLQAGLPIGPISAPGHTAIDAALHPADGTWLYFCAINLKTGETVFSTTYAEHEKAVQLWRQWMLQNPGWNG